MIGANVFAVEPWSVTERELHLDLAKTLFLQFSGRLYDLLERQITAQRAARISRDTLARAAEKFP